MTALYTFHTTIHARPSQVAAGPTLEFNGVSIATLTIVAELLGTTTFDRSFEQTRAALSELDRMYCEPDGSFVWVSSRQDALWQVDGNLYDRNERLLFVDAKGTCPADQFDRLLTALGWPGVPVMFQSVREAVLLSEAEFRRWAAR